MPQSKLLEGGMSIRDGIVHLLYRIPSLTVVLCESGHGMPLYMPVTWLYRTLITTSFVLTITEPCVIAKTKEKGFLLYSLFSSIMITIELSGFVFDYIMEQ